MITASVPLRVSLLGGGTDLPENVEMARRDGASLTISLPFHVHCVIESSMTGKPSLEFDSRVDTPLTNAIYDSSIAIKWVHTNKICSLRVMMCEDVPTKGTGLGSSAAWVRANLNAILGRYDEDVHTAYDIERSTGSSCGYQDHAAAAFPGINFFRFFPTKHSWSFERDALKCDWLLKSLCLIRVEGHRDSNAILARQASTIDGKVMNAMVELANEGRTISNLQPSKGARYLGNLIRESWELKKTYAPSVTNDVVDSIIQEALDRGAHGAKILGAGGCGYVLAIVDPDKMSKFIQGWDTPVYSF